MERTGTPITPGHPYDPSVVGNTEKRSPPPPEVQIHPGAPIGAFDNPVSGPTPQEIRARNEQLGVVPDEPSEHEIIRKLREQLGIKLVSPKKHSLVGREWIFGPLTYEDIEWVMGNIHGGVTDYEFQQTMRVATVAMSIRAIDGVPTYKLFGIDKVVSDALPIVDELNPPPMLRILSAEKLLALFRSEIWGDLVPNLWEAYVDLIDSKMRIAPFAQEISNEQKSETNTSQTGEKSLQEPDISLPTP